MIRTAFALLLLTAVPAPCFPQALLDNADLSGIASTVARFQAKDAFDARPDESAAIGRRFRISIPLLEGEGGPITRAKSGWTYDVDRGVLHLAVPAKVELSTQYDGLGNGPRRRFPVITFESQSTDLGRQDGETALGVRFSFESYRGTLLQVGELTPPNRPSLFARELDASLAKDIPMPAEDARRAVQGLTVVIEGQTVDLSPGRLTACRESGTRASLDLPIQSLIKVCSINAVIDQVSIQSPTAGVLAEWRAPA